MSDRYSPVLFGAPPVLLRPVVVGCSAHRERAPGTGHRLHNFTAVRDERARVAKRGEIRGPSETSRRHVQ